MQDIGSAQQARATLRARLEVFALVVCGALNLYLLGAATLLLAVSYPMLGAAGSAALPALYAALNARLGLSFVLPEFLAFLAVLPLLALRPPRIPARAVWVCIALGVVWFVVTFGWHLPAHKVIAMGDASPPVMQWLLVSHATRTASLALKCGILSWMIIALGRRRDNS